MNFFRTIPVFVLFSLCAAYSYADRAAVTHNFSSLIDAGKLEYKNSYKTGITSLLTYTCSNGAEFGLDPFNALGYKEHSINLQNTNEFVTTTVVDSLAGIQLQYLKRSGYAPSIELRLSRDSVHWSDPIDATSTTSGSTSGGYTYDFVPGRYFVRLTSKSDNDVSITQLKYFFGWCNCFLYIPE